MGLERRWRLGVDLAAVAEGEVAHRAYGVEPLAHAGGGRVESFQVERKDARHASDAVAHGRLGALTLVARHLDSVVVEEMAEKRLHTRRVATAGCLLGQVEELEEAAEPEHLRHLEHLDDREQLGDVALAAPRPPRPSCSLPAPSQWAGGSRVRR